MRLVTTLASTKKIKVTLFLLLMAGSIFGRKSSIPANPPVFWNVFNAEVDKNKVILKWVVTEYNNKGFYIEHSLDGNNWKTIDSIDTKNSPLTLDEYSYTHVNKLEGRQFYRVRQVDIDLTRTGYSKVLSVVLAKEKQDSDVLPAATLTPNPATGQVKIVNPPGNQVIYTSAMFFDLSGKKVAEKRPDSHSNIIDIRDLPAGIYFIHAENNEGNSFTQKIIKN